MKKTFPNGFSSWAETHFEVVQFISSQEEGFVNNGTVIEYVREFIGIGGMYDLAELWTDKFEKENQGKVWGEDVVFFDALDEFLTRENSSVDMYHSLGSPS